MVLATLSDTKNLKLGPLIHSWSIPAGRAWACPGESCLCRTRCYAKKGFFCMPTVQEAHLRNFQFCQTELFEAWMKMQLMDEFVRVMRVHVSGDFYSIEYIRKWLRIVQESRRQHFFAYTRSWRIEEMLPELIKLAAEPNFQMWWSMDRETGPAPLIRGIRRAYMAINDVDANLAPDDCDLIFRYQPRTKMKRANGVLVCPPENGVKTKVKITCSRCGICWNKRVTKWEVDLLPYLQQTSTEINVPAA